MSVYKFSEIYDIRHNDAIVKDRKGLMDNFYQSDKDLSNVKNPFFMFIEHIKTKTFVDFVYTRPKKIGMIGFKTEEEAVEFQDNTDPDELYQGKVFVVNKVIKLENGSDASAINKIFNCFIAAHQYVMINKDSDEYPVKQEVYVTTDIHNNLYGMVEYTGWEIVPKKLFGI